MPFEPVKRGERRLVDLIHLAGYRVRAAAHETRKRSRRLGGARHPPCGEVRPKRLVIGIDPESVEIDPVEAAKLEGVEWVNIASVPAIPQRREGASRYLHAKVFWFASKQEELLVTGSANPSVAKKIRRSSRRC